MTFTSSDFLHAILTFVSAVNGNWGQWTAYGACSVTCGVGTHQRTRSCDSPAPSGGGTTCPGDALEAKTCFDVTCYPSILGSLERVGIQYELVHLLHKILLSSAGLEQPI